MDQDPNAWWSKEIGRDLNKGMLEPFRDLKKLGPKELSRRILFRLIPIALAEAVLFYLFYYVLKVLQRHIH